MRKLKFGDKVKIIELCTCGCMDGQKVGNYAIIEHVIQDVLIDKIRFLNNNDVCFTVWSNPPTNNFELVDPNPVKKADCM